MNTELSQLFSVNSNPEINTHFSLDNHSAAKLAEVQLEQQGRIIESGHRCVYMLWKNGALNKHTKKDMEAEEEENEISIHPCPCLWYFSKQR